MLLPVVSHSSFQAAHRPQSGLIAHEFMEKPSPSPKPSTHKAFFKLIITFPLHFFG